jgi:hypothetical protein
MRRGSLRWWVGLGFIATSALFVATLRTLGADAERSASEGNPSESEALRALERDAEELRDELRALHGQYALLHEELRSAKSGDARGAAEPAAPVVAAPAETPGATPMAEPPAPRRDDLEILDEAFVRQRPDPNWSHEVQGSILNALDKAALPDSALERVECQQSLCRVEFAQSGDAPFELSAIEGMGTPIDGELYLRFVDAPDGTTRTVVFLPRPGESLKSFRGAE